jgi:cell division ATPase FtsA
VGNKIALIYIDDTQVYGVLAKRDVNGAFVKDAENSIEYNGVMNGKFNDADDFARSFGSVLSSLTANFKNRKDIPNSVYIAVPNCFRRIKSDELNADFGKPVRIKSNHIRSIMASIDGDIDGAVTISKEVVYYQADNDEPTIGIRGAIAKVVTAFYSVIGVTQEFFSAIPTGAIYRCGFQNIKFLSVASAEVFLFPEPIRDGGCTLIRSDFFSTGLVHILGDCATYVSNHNIGIGHIINEIMDSFSVNYPTATKLLREGTATVDMAPDDNYIVNGRSFPAQIVNKLVKKQLDRMAAQLKKEKTATVLYSSGEILDNIFGAKNILSNAFGTDIETAADSLTRDNFHPETTINALLRYIAR